MFSRLKHFDAYPKPLEDFRVKTLSGAFITVFCTFFIVVLFLLEWRSYMTIEVDQELFVDLTRNEKLTININLTFPHLPCALLSVDAMDVSGEHQNDVVQGLKKIQLSKDGQVIPPSKLNSSTTTTTPETTTLPIVNAAAGNMSTTTLPKCQSCYGAESSQLKCCNTCDDVRIAYRHRNWHFSPYGVEQCKAEFKADGNNMQATVALEDIDKLLSSGEGCRMAGHLDVNKVAGNFHIAPGVSYQQNHMHVHDIKNMPLGRFNTGHYFDVFSFGDEYPNQFNPLEKKSVHEDWADAKLKNEQTANANPLQQIMVGSNIISFDFFSRGEEGKDDAAKNAVSYSYFIKIVPTTYQYINGRVVNNTYQYSVTKSAKLVGMNGGGQLPGIFISYELSPIMVKYLEKSKPFSHFVTSCCAIVGGLFTIAGMLDAFTFRYYNLYKKYQINKLT